MITELDTSPALIETLESPNDLAVLHKKELILIDLHSYKVEGIQTVQNIDDVDYNLLSYRKQIMKNDKFILYHRTLVLDDNTILVYYNKRKKRTLIAMYEVYNVKNNTFSEPNIITCAKFNALISLHNKINAFRIDSYTTFLYDHSNNAFIIDITTNTIQKYRIKYSPYMRQISDNKFSTFLGKDIILYEYINGDLITTNYDIKINFGYMYTFSDADTIWFITVVGLNTLWRYTISTDRYHEMKDIKIDLQTSQESKLFMYKIVFDHITRSLIFGNSKEITILKLDDDNNIIENKVIPFDNNDKARYKLVKRHNKQYREVAHNTLNNHLIGYINKNIRGVIEKFL